MFVDFCGKFTPSHNPVETVPIFFTDPVDLSSHVALRLSPTFHIFFAYGCYY